MADQTAYQRICAEACEWCAKGYRQCSVDHGSRPFHLPCGFEGDIVPCTAPTKDAVIERHAGELERVRMEAAKLGHEPGCAKYNYAGTHCTRCGIGEVHSRGRLCDGSFDHKWHVTPISPCDCAQSRIQGGTSK